MSDSRIVVMHYDDIARNPANPHPGKIINIPGGTARLYSLVFIRSTLRLKSGMRVIYTASYWWREQAPCSVDF